MPFTSRDEVNFPSCSMVMQALAALKNDIQKLKAEESLGAAGGGDDVTREVTKGDADRPLVQVLCSDSTARISGFASNSAIHCLSSDDSDSQEERIHGSVLMQCARAFVLWMECMLRFTGRSLYHMFATARERNSTKKFWR